MSPRSSPCETTTVAGIEAHDLDVAQRDRQVRGIDDPDRRLVVDAVSALAGIEMPGVDFSCMPPGHRRAKAHRRAADRSG